MHGCATHTPAARGARVALLSAVLAATALAGAACGKATVESSDVTASTSAAPSAASSAAPSAQSSATQSSVREADPQPEVDNERPAREIESIPAAHPRYSVDEQAFLDAIREQGVNVEGVEDQLTATGRSVCEGTTFTRDAVAGQLVEQRRTNLDPAAMATLLGDTARAHLC